MRAFVYTKDICMHRQKHMPARNRQNSQKFFKVSDEPITKNQNSNQTLFNLISTVPALHSLSFRQPILNFLINTHVFLIPTVLRIAINYTRKPTKTLSTKSQTFFPLKAFPFSSHINILYLFIHLSFFSEKKTFKKSPKFTVLTT